MKILSAEQVRNWDAYTIENTPIASIDLMERAAEECFLWLMQHLDIPKQFIIFCGPGNNGGDGLALARKLYHAKQAIKIFILAAEKKSADLITNIERLDSEHIPYHFIDAENKFPLIENDLVIIDALFGTGLHKPLEGSAAQLVNHINRFANKIVSVDMPSGLFADKTSKDNIVIKAAHTLSFQLYKLAFLLPENADAIGDVHILNIGLQPEFYTTAAVPFSIIDKTLIRSIYKPRKKIAHKYDYGNALLYTGSKNMIGAAILSAKACLRSGAGLVTIHATENISPVIHTAIPEVITTGENDLEKAMHKKNAIAIGPGLEASEINNELLQKIIKEYNGPLVIDATALGLLAGFPELLSQRKQYPAILTPHTGEFEKLFGKTNNDLERIELAMTKAISLNCYIILKGHYTFIATPAGKGFFNINGNPGMATAGSGDVLTGMVTGLLAQGYIQQDACILSVYLHGFAGDIAAAKFSEEAMVAGDIIECFGDAFKKIQQ